MPTQTAAALVTPGRQTTVGSVHVALTRVKETVLAAGAAAT